PRLAARTASAEGTAENLLEVNRTAAKQIAQIDRSRAGAAGAPAGPGERLPLRAAAGKDLAELVVLLALLGVLQDVVRLLHLLEPLGSVFVLVGVGMILLRQLFVGPADLVGGGGFRNAKGFVVIVTGHEDIL